MKLRNPKQAYVDIRNVPVAEQQRRLADGLKVWTRYDGDLEVARMEVANWFKETFNERLIYVSTFQPTPHYHAWLARTKSQAALLKTRFG
jgi:hypothetical protein